MKPEPSSQLSFFAYDERGDRWLLYHKADGWAALGLWHGVESRCAVEGLDCPPSLDKVVKLAVILPITAEGQPFNPVVHAKIRPR